MRGGVVFRKRNLRERHARRRVEKPEPEQCAQKFAELQVDDFLLDEAALHRVGKRGRVVAAAHTEPRGNRHRLGFGVVLRDFIVAAEVGDGAAVGRDVPVEAPAIEQRVELRVDSSWFAVDRIVGGHDRLDVAFAHERFERGQVGLIEIRLGWRRVERVARRLRPAVHREVLRARRRQQVARIVALQPAHERHADARREPRVLAIGFLPAAPARVAKDVDVRRPEREPVKARADIGVGGERVVKFRARLDADHAGDLLHECVVPRRREPDGLRKHRGLARARDAVERLVPPVVFRDAEPRHAGRGVAHGGGFFVERHPRDEVAHARLERLGRIEIKRTRLVRTEQAADRGER